MASFLNISWRNIKQSQSIESLILEKAEKLEQVCDHIDSCEVTLEKSTKQLKTGRRYQVRVEVSAKPDISIVIISEAGKGDKDEELKVTIRNTFKTVWRQLREATRQKRGYVKAHPMQEVQAIVTQIFPDEGYGFIKPTNGSEIYFHKNSVLNDQFDRMNAGTGVRYVEKEGEKGPQASSVQIVNKPGT